MELAAKEAVEQLDNQQSSTPSSLYSLLSVFFFLISIL
jgi:hypothetical protein